MRRPVGVDVLDPRSPHSTRKRGGEGDDGKGSHEKTRRSRVAMKTAPHHAEA